VSEPILATDSERDIALALDLRQASLAGPKIEIEAQAILGSVEVIVTEGVEVAVSGGGLLSGEDLRIEGTVRSRPPLTDEIKAQIRRYL